MGSTALPLPKDAITNTNEAKLPADATSAPTTPVYSHGASGSWEEAPWYDRALPPNIANAYMKAKNFLNKPLLSHIPEIELPVAAAKTASQYLKSRGYTKAPKILDAYTGTMEGISDTAQAMSTPINLGMMFSLGRLKTLGVAGTALDRLISAGFSAQMLHQAYAQLPDVKKAIDSGDWEAAARAITSETGTAVLGGLAAHGAVENTAVEPKQAEFQKTENPSSVKPMTREEITRAVSQLPPETTEEAKARRYQSAQIRHIQKISAATPSSIQFTKDSNGITWATDKSVSPNPVSIPDNIPANEREAYAADKLKQQGEMAAALKKRLLAIPGAIEVPQNTKYTDFLNKAITRAVQEGYGQSILDDMSDKNISPRDVTRQFWDKTYFELPAESQQKFQNYLRKVTGFKPGDVIGVNADKTPMIAQDWADIADKILDVGDDAEYLEGTTRGLVAGMKEANDLIAKKSKLSEIPKTINLLSQATAAPVAESYHPDLQKVVDKYGETENASDIKNGASFITPNGKFVHLGTTDHDDAIAAIVDKNGDSKYSRLNGGDNRPEFLNTTGTIRVRFSQDRAGDTVHISVPAQGVTEAQIPALRQAIAQAGRYGNVVMERADVNPENVSTASMTKEFPRPSETEDYLRQIQAHPDQKIQPWMEKAANDAQGGFSVNPQNGKTPTKGKILSILPEAEVDLGHPATPEDIRDYYNKHKALFDAHPELHIGGYGNELNISAIGPHAEEVAKKLDQHSVYDLGEGKEILTGGKNKQKSFPDYSLEQRLADLKGEVSKTSHATLAPIPVSLKGDNPAITDESIHGHEYGHGAQAIINGAQLAELRSYMHPENIGNAAAAVVRWPSGGAKTYDEWIAKDPNNALNAIQNSLAGPLTQEVVYGIPMNENPGIAGDMRDIRQALDTLGLTLAQQEDVMDYLIKGWKDKLTAKNPLTGRTLGDIIKQYAPRDEDIRAELLASPNKIDKFAEEVRQHENEVRQHENRQREGNNRGNVTGVSEGTEQIGRENVARTEGLSANSNISKSLRAIPGAIQVTAKYTPKGSAVPLLEKPLPTEAGAQRTFVPEKIHQGVSIENPVVADFQRAMGDWMKKTAGSIKEPDANLKRSINLAHNEINHWIMENGGEGKGWYRRKTDSAIKVLSKAHPQLKDPAHATIFKALWTAHSYGNDPDINMAEAEQNLSNLEDKGKIEYNKGTKTNGETLHWSGHSGNAYTLAKTQHLIDKYGEDGAAKWLTTKHPWSEIQNEFKDSGLNVSKHGIALDKDGKAYGAMAFGPKGGAFFLNLNGINDHTTVDVWGARALRRWEGRIGSPDTLKKDYDSGLTTDQPPDAGEISRFHKVIQSVAKKLNLDTDDVQALQWYFEHKLYEVHGVGEKARDYEEAAKNVINKKGTGEPINALDLLRTLGKWKSSVQSRGNEGAGVATPKAGQNAVSRNLFENH